MARRLNNQAWASIVEQNCHDETVINLLYGALAATLSGTEEPANRHDDESENREPLNTNSLFACYNQNSHGDTRQYHYYPDTEYDEGLRSFSQPLLICDQGCCVDGGRVTRTRSRFTDEATILFNLGIAYSRRGEDREALMHLQESLSIQQRQAFIAIAMRTSAVTTRGSNNPTASIMAMGGPPLFAILHNIGHSHVNRENFTEAVSSYRTALDILLDDSAGGGTTSRRSETSSTLNCLAMAMHYGGRNSNDRQRNQILTYLENALALRLSCSVADDGDHDRDIATIINNSGRVRFSWGDFRNALALFREAYRRRVATLGEDHIDVASSLLGMAQAEERLSQITEAIALYKRYIDIAISKRGEDSKDITRVLIMIGALCHKSRDFDQAYHYFSRALTSAEQAFGPREKAVAKIMNQIGNTLCEQGKLDNALDIYQRGLAIERNLYFSLDSSLNIATTLINIAQIYGEQRKWDEALKMYLEALEIKRRHGGDQKGVTRVLSNLGSIYIEKIMYSDAVTVLREALALLRKGGVDISPSSTEQQQQERLVHELSSTLNYLGLAQLNAGSYSLALQSFMEALYIFRSSSPSLDLHTAKNTTFVINMCLNAASACTSVGEINRALEFYKEALRLGQRHHQSQDEGEDRLASNSRVIMDDNNGQQQDSSSSQLRGSTSTAAAMTVMKPKHLAILHQKIGLLLQECGDLDNALQSLEIASKMCEEHERTTSAIDAIHAYEIFKSLGNVLLQMGNTERALEAFTAAARMNDGVTLSEIVNTSYILIHLLSGVNPSGAAAA